MPALQPAGNYGGVHGGEVISAQSENAQHASTADNCGGMRVGEGVVPNLIQAYGMSSIRAQIISAQSDYTQHASAADTCGGMRALKQCKRRAQPLAR